MIKNPSINASDVRGLGLIPGLGRPPEKGMATHSSILAWRITWIEEAGRLQSMGPQTVRYGTHMWLICNMGSCNINK